MILILIFYVIVLVYCDDVKHLSNLQIHQHQRHHRQNIVPIWEVNNPSFFNISNSHNHNGELLDVRNDPSNITHFETISQWHLDRTDAFTDGEVVDAIEHFFWGKRNGIAMEL